MKLIACHIDNFGKLSDLSISFSDGVNVINEANAWGKSTLAAFLKAMFYGLDAKKETGAFQKERVLYRPWQGGAFGGEVDFELNGKKFRISRTFGRTEKEDVFHLYDLRTNLECFDYSEDIGTEIFDLDSASFKRTIYIAQNDCTTNTSDKINAKLGNLAENTDDINNFESASRHMKDILNQLTPDRVTGSIKKRKNYITQLSQELLAFDAAQEGMEGIQRKDRLVSSQIQELMEIRKNYAAALVLASEDSRKKELYVQYDAICKDVAEKENKVEELKEFFPNGVPAKEEFQEQMKNARAVEAKKAQLKSLELTINEHESWSKLHEMFEFEVPTIQKIDTSLETLASADKQKESLAILESHLALTEAELEEDVVRPHDNSVIHKVFIFMGLGILLVGIVVGVVLSMNILPIASTKNAFISAIFAVVVGAILSLLGAITGYREEKLRAEWQKTMDEEHATITARCTELTEQITELKDYINQVNGTVGTFLGRFHVFCKVEEYPAKLYELKNQLVEYERLAAKLEESMEERKALEKEQVKIVEFTKKYGYTSGEDIASVLELYQNKAMEYTLAVSAYEDALKKREAFEGRQDKSFWNREAVCPYSIDELNDMIQQADAKIEELKAAKVQYTKQLENLQEQLDLRDEKQAELEEQMYLQEQDTKKYNLIKTTHDFLQRAKEQFTARYMDPIANGFSKYYQMLTGDTSGEWMIDANINLKLRQQGELRETQWLSAGYQDLLGVCMRLALVDAMYQDEKPFLILDDPFVNLDKEKVEAGNKLLMDVAKEYQVIYFTCHDSRSPRI